MLHCSALRSMCIGYTAKLLASAISSEVNMTQTPLTKLTEEEEMLISSVRSFCQQHVAPCAIEMDRNAKMNMTMLNEAFKAGLMGIEIPVEYGGGGMNFFSSILAIEEVAKFDAATAVTVDVQNTLVNNIFFRYANEEQMKKYLPRLATKDIGCFCLTEATSGSDAFALKTRAEKNSNGNWVINGSKLYITNGGFGSLYLVMANVDFSKKYKGITCFLVDKEVNPGITVAKSEDKLGLRASSTVELHFDNVEVSPENVIGEIGKGYQVAINTLNEGRIGIGAQMIGIAQGAFDIIMPYLFQRKQFGQYIGDFQGMQMEYAECATQLQAARLLVYNAARKKLNNENFVQDAAMAKYYSSKIAEKMASKAIEWAGGVGFMKDFGLERMYRDAKIGAIYEGTSIIQLQAIAKLLRAQYAKEKYQ